MKSVRDRSDADRSGRSGRTPQRAFAASENTVDAAARGTKQTMRGTGLVW